MTAARGAEWRKWLDKELHSAQIAAHKGNLAAIKKKIADERQARANKLQEARATCKASYQAVKDRADEAYRKAIELAREHKPRRRRRFDGRIEDAHHQLESSPGQAPVLCG